MCLGGFLLVKKKKRWVQEELVSCGSHEQSDRRKRETGGGINVDTAGGPVDGVSSSLICVLKGVCVRVHVCVCVCVCVCV